MNIAALCAKVEISRDSFYLWKRSDPNFPKVITVETLTDYMRETGRGPYSEAPNASSPPPDDSAEETDIARMSERQLKVEERRVKVETARFALDCKKENMIPKADVDAVWAASITGVNNILDALSERLAMKITDRSAAAFLAFLRAKLRKAEFAPVDAVTQTSPFEFHDAKEIAAHEVDIAKAAMASGEWLQPEDRE